MKININRRLASLMVAGTIALSTLSGCGNKIVEFDSKTEASILDNTLLSKSDVITYYDGSKDIVKKVTLCTGDSHEIYHSVITGQYIVDSRCGNEELTLRNENNEVTSIMLSKHGSIIKVESINNYLTKEELAKAMNGTLTQEDIIEIVSRTILPEKEEAKEKH